jgi:hypothetical protein
LKEEILNHPSHRVIIDAIDAQLKMAQELMNTEYIKEMVIADGRELRHNYDNELGKHRGRYYDMAVGALITVGHVLSVLLYCNFTKLCTLFSSTFRKLSASETDVELRDRHSYFREWAKLLVETVHCYGQLMDDENTPNIFLHGISIPMTFTSTFARFCSATSTTSSIVVAANFGKQGIILELMNNTESTLSCFSCQVLSAFSNEDEFLFIGGGFDAVDYSHFFDIALPFKSIRNLELSENYKVFITPFTQFQQMINGSYLTKKISPVHVQYLQKIIDYRLSVSQSHGCGIFNSNGDNHDSNHNTRNSNNNNNGGINIPLYVESLTNYYFLNRDEVIVLNIHSMNTNFTLFCDIFCETYSAERMNEMKAIPNTTAYGYTNMIRGIKLALFVQLFPRLKRMSIAYLPLTRNLMHGILRFYTQVFQHNNNHNKEDNKDQFIDFELVIADENKYYDILSDFHGNYQLCVEEYEAKFKDIAIQLSVVYGLNFQPIIP